MLPDDPKRDRAAHLLSPDSDAELLTALDRFDQQLLQRSLGTAFMGVFVWGVVVLISNLRIVFELTSVTNTDGGRWTHALRLLHWSPLVTADVAVQAAGSLLAVVVSINIAFAASQRPDPPTYSGQLAWARTMGLLASAVAAATVSLASASWIRREEGGELIIDSGTGFAVSAIALFSVLLASSLHEWVDELTTVAYRLRRLRRKTALRSRAADLRGLLRPVGIGTAAKWLVTVTIGPWALLVAGWAIYLAISPARPPSASRSDEIVFLTATALVFILLGALLTAGVCFIAAQKWALRRTPLVVGCILAALWLILCGLIAAVAALSSTRPFAVATSSGAMLLVYPVALLLALARPASRLSAGPTYLSRRSIAAEWRRLRSSIRSAEARIFATRVPAPASEVQGLGRAEVFPPVGEPQSGAEHDAITKTRCRRVDVLSRWIRRSRFSDRWS